MKKLMIAAAAVAMIASAQADTVPQYKLVTNEVEFAQTQVLTWKRAKDTDKYINLNAGNKFGKTVKFVDEAVDGVIYYSSKKGGWIGFTWSKDADSCSTNSIQYAYRYNVYVDATATNTLDATTKKAIAAYGAIYEKKPGDLYDWYTGEVNSNAVNAVANFYGTLKVKNGALVADNNGAVIKSIKSTSGAKVSLKTYNSIDKKNNAVNKLIEKALKVYSDAAYKAYLESIKE